jgi:ComF family protein
MGAFFSFTRNFGGALLDFFYPPSCLSCQSPRQEGQSHVCSGCWQRIGKVHSSHELYVETHTKLLETSLVDGLIAVFVFEKDGVFQHIAHALKYEGYESLGLELGKRLGESILGSGQKADGLLPIPLHKRKLRERGYNQAELIALGASEVSGIPVRSDILRRQKYTQTQTKLTIEERMKNMQDAFGVVKDVSGMHLIVVDDVITTGSTIIFCAKELKAAGASRVVAASAALAK